MSTVAAAHTKTVVPAVKATFPSAVLSGIVPDERHLNQGGYHCSINDLNRFGKNGDYSNRNTKDKAPPVTAVGRQNACAVDISLSESDMARMFRNVERVWTNRHSDTRAQFINAINVWDGNRDHAPVRFNFQLGTRAKASADHTWHAHADWVRLFVDQGYSLALAQRAARAMVSTMIGQSHDAWQRQEKIGPYVPKPPKPSTPTPPPNPIEQEEDDMSWNVQRNLPLAYAYGPDGQLLGDPSVAAAAVVSLPTSPAGHKDHRWGKDYRLYLSLAADHLPEGVSEKVRVAVHDGKTWTVNVYDVTGGARQNCPVPPPVTQSAYNITVGRVSPAVQEGKPPAVPSGAVAVLIEAIHN